MSEVKYKDFSKSKIIGYDIETYDSNLKELGPGVYRKDGHILGFSLADETGFGEYYNVGHYDVLPEEKKKNLDYLKEVMQLKHVPKLGAKIIYDLDWTENYQGIKIEGQLYDIQIAEALIDENKMHLNLDALSKDYLGVGKYKNEIDEFCEFNNLKGDSRKWLFKMPYQLVRQYGIEDAKKPIQIFKKQWLILHSQNLLELFHLECDLIRVMLLMRKTGTRIDVKKRNINALNTHNYLTQLEMDTFEKYGTFNMNSSKQIANIFDYLNIPYPLTTKNNPSITTDVLKSLMAKDYPLAEEIFNCKKAGKILNNFLMGSFKRNLCEDGLIHASFYNTKIEQGSGGLRGTRSGRFSMANPNLQQIPSKSVDEHWGQTCREVFIPFDDCWWGKVDYSQIEYRFMAHFAVGPGSEEVRKRYNQDAKTDYHQYIIDLTGLKRRFAKNLNFGVAYGMGPKTMASFFTWTLDYCYEILDTYHKAAPFIRSTIEAVEQSAKRKGFITTFLNRRSRLIDRNKVYTMFCRLIQGSAADLMKKSMLDVYKDGIFNVLKPHITVHDELDVSIPKSKEGLEAFEEMKNIMENCVKLKVPVVAEAEIGDNWADLVAYDRNNFKEF